MGKLLTNEEQNQIASDLKQNIERMLREALRNEIENKSSYFRGRLDTFLVQKGYLHDLVDDIEFTLTVDKLKGVD